MSEWIIVNHWILKTKAIWLCFCLCYVITFNPPVYQRVDEGCFDEWRMCSDLCSQLLIFPLCLEEAVCSISTWNMKIIYHQFKKTNLVDSACEFDEIWVFGSDFESYSRTKIESLHQMRLLKQFEHLDKKHWESMVMYENTKSITIRCNMYCCRKLNLRFFSQSRFAQSQSKCWNGTKQKCSKKGKHIHGKKDIIRTAALN